MRICGGGYTVLENFETHEICFELYFDMYRIDGVPQQKILPTPDSSFSHILNEMMETVFSTAQKQAQSAGKNFTLWASIIHRGSTDAEEFHAQSKRLSSTRFLLMKYF